MPKDDPAVYGIICSKTGKIYVGSGRYPYVRKSQHFCMLRNNRHHSRHLQSAYNKHGADAFEFLILETVSDVLFLQAREQFWIWRNKGRLYNCGPVAGCPSGIKRSKKFVANRIQAMTGNCIRKGFRSSEETRQAISSSLLGNSYRKGIPHDDLTRSKISEAMKRAHATGKHPGFAKNRLDTSKLTAEQVKAIRQDKRPGRALGLLYKVSRVCIDDVKARRTWRHVP